MIDVISRQAAINAVKIFLEQTDAPEVYPGLIPALARVINNVPSAQPEIIQCKDCKYWNDEFAKDKSTCWLPCMSMTTHREWYCGSAERRTDE